MGCGWVDMKTLGRGERIYGLWLGGYDESAYWDEDIWAVVGWL
jgi:hypothetical protein